MNYELIKQHITPRTVIDVGARLGDFTLELQQVMPKFVSYLIEANPECAPTLKERFTPLGYEIAVLSAVKKLVPFYTLFDCATATGASYYREKSDVFTDDRIKVTLVETTTLDDVMVDKAITLPLLLKLDTQGSECDVLHGARNILPLTQAIVIEIPEVEYNIGAPDKQTYFKALGHHGFRHACELGDIVLSGVTVQKDHLFVRK